VSFRFLALSPPQFDALRQHRPDVMSRPSRGRPGQVTGVFDLCENEDYAWMKPFIAAHEIPFTDYGLFVSISTSSDSEIVRVPQFASDIYREIGGVLDFSFTVLADE
jgi:hypothetical protein